MPLLSRRRFVLSAALATAIPSAGRVSADQAAPRSAITVYKSPFCGCCSGWVDHLRAAGFHVETRDMDDVSPIKAQLGVAPDLHSCHTGIVDGYVVEGHVPAADIVRLLDERPAAKGLAVPGMPIGSPGMEQGNRSEPYEVILFAASGRRVFARH